MDRELVETLFQHAVAAARPELAIRAHLPPRPLGRTVVIGAGKASAQMARAFEAAWDGYRVGALADGTGTFDDPVVFFDTWET